MTGLSDVELSAVARVLQDAGAAVTGPLVARPVSGGRSNLTFRLDDGTSAWVLRMPPRSGRTPSAHDVAREYRVTKALRGSDVPVPRPVVLCGDESVVGAPFAVAEFVEGRTVQSRADLDELEDVTLDALTAVLVETLATLHRVDYVAVGLENLGRADSYAARQLKRWTGQWTAVGQPHLGDLAVELANLLAGAVPKQRATGIVHGDFRIDNTLLDLSGRPAVAAVVDWELCTLGDPVADVAMMCAYRHPAFDLIVGSASAWTSPRLASPERLAAAYEKAGGVELTDWSRHLGLAYFKIAVIAAGIDRRFRMGSGAGPGFDSAGEAVEPFLRAGILAIAESS